MLAIVLSKPGHQVGVRSKTKIWGENLTPVYCKAKGHHVKLDVRTGIGGVLYLGSDMGKPTTARGVQWTLAKCPGEPGGGVEGSVRVKGHSRVEVGHQGHHQVVLQVPPHVGQVHDWFNSHLIKFFKNYAGINAPTSFR